MGEGSNLLLFLLGFLAARLLAPESFGQYSTAFAFVGLFRLLPDFGMSYAATLDISRDRSLAGPIVGRLLGFQCVLSVVALALCLGIAAGQYTGITWIAVLVLSLDLVLKAWKSTLRWLLKALERFGAEAVSLVAERLLILTLGAASLLLGYGVVGFVLAFATVRALDTAALHAYVHARVVRLTLRYDPPAWSSLLRRGVPFAYAGLMITMFFQVDTVILERIRGPVEVGWYRAPVLVLEGLTLVPRILGYALIPTMAAVHARSPESVTALYRRGSKYLALAGLPIGAFGLLASEPFMRLLFGADYGPSVAVSRILLPAAAFMFLSNFGETALACVNRWRAIVVISTGALALNVALNLAWIPTHGYVGAAWATLVTEGLYFLSTAVALARYGHRLSWPQLVVRPVAAAAVFAAVLWAARGLALPLSAALASLAFVLATVVLGVWDEKERRLVRDLVRGRPPDAGSLA
jgi:O-antigen/teichoic acid export membrane protein